MRIITRLDVLIVILSLDTILNDRWYVLFFYKNLIGLDWVGLEDGETCSWARPLRLLTT